MQDVIELLRTRHADRGRCYSCRSICFRSNQKFYT